MIGLDIGGTGLFRRRRNRAAFVGAYDAIPSITAAYGMRRLRTSYAGSLLRIRRSADNTEQDIGYTGAGDLDTAAIATFIGGGSGYIVTWYDQSGNGYDATQTTAANQPLYVASGQNGRPVGRWDGSDDYLRIPSGLIASGNFSLFLTGMQAAANARFFLTANGTSSRWGLYSENATGEKQAALVNGATGFVGGAITLSRWYLHGYLHNAGANTLFQNGNSAGSTSLAASYTGTATNIGTNGAANTFLSGDIAELIICNAALSTGDRGAAEAAANSYWAVY